MWDALKRGESLGWIGEHERNGGIQAWMREGSHAGLPRSSRSTLFADARVTPPSPLHRARQPRSPTSFRPASTGRWQRAFSSTRTPELVGFRVDVAKQCARSIAVIGCGGRCRATFPESLRASCQARSHSPLAQRLGDSQQPSSMSLACVSPNLTFFNSAPTLRYPYSYADPSYCTLRLEP